jgi:hypothetical protein
MTLLMHCGAEDVPYERLRALETPEATKSHVPIPHHRIVDLVKFTLAHYGHEVSEENHGVTEDGNRYFGLLSLRSTYGDFEDTVGLRNSHDKKFPVGISFGAKVFVCDNLSFYGDQTVMRRHTVNATRDLPGMVMGIIEPLADQRDAQYRKFERYKGSQLSDELADHVILELYRRSIINVQRIADVMNGWDNPPHEEWGERTAWRMFNSTTSALEGRIAEKPQITQQLHDVIDGVCTVH